MARPQLYAHPTNRRGGHIMIAPSVNDDLSEESEVAAEDERSPVCVLTSPCVMRTNSYMLSSDFLMYTQLIALH